MNFRKLKLALTVGLMNAAGTANALSAVKELVLDFKEVGAFIGDKLVGKDTLNASNVRQRYLLQFENCTIDLDLVSNQHTQQQIVQSFNLR